MECKPAAGNVCVSSDIFSCEADGRVGEMVKRCWPQACYNGECGESACLARSRLIYVVDDEWRLLSFSPAGETYEFQLIGTLDCPAGPSWPAWPQESAPFSMSVDRHAIAWVLYNSGEIFWVDTATAKCQPSVFQKGQKGFELFGMGFVSDGPGSNQEKLFISGGEVNLLQVGDLGYIDPATTAVTKIGPLPQAEQSPELTGTGNGSLFAYFPGATSPFVAELDKSTGQIKQKWFLPATGDTVTAWAFAHWGGDFFIFVSSQPLFGSEERKVLRLNPTSGQTQTIMTDVPYRIVGAGVSTCAPVQ
ncbi:MAG: hypothetical protein V1754_08375 [Pseudomonadota bacterium]